MSTYYHAAPHWCASVLAMHQVGARGCCFEATPLKRIPVLAAGRVPYQAQALTKLSYMTLFYNFLFFMKKQTTCIVIGQDAKTVLRRTIFALSFCFI